MSLEKSTELRAEFTKLQASLKDIQKTAADLYGDDEVMVKHQEVMNDVFNMVDSMVGNVHSRVGLLEDKFYSFTSKHLKNHLPNPSTASDMEKALKGLGLQNNFDVIKPMVFVDSRTNDIVGEVDMSRAKKNGPTPPNVAKVTKLQLVVNKANKDEV